MVKLDLSITLRCAVPGCLAGPVQRHHRGCEHMWIDHFKARYRTKQYQDFKARYELFLPSDCTPLCAPHHRIVHGIYYPIISRAARRRGPCAGWTWAEAEALMQRLREELERWLVTAQ